jgi:hypothetical protein
MLLFAMTLIVIAPWALTQRDEAVLWILAPGSLIAGAAFAGYGAMLATALDEFERFLPPSLHPSKPVHCTPKLTPRPRRIPALVPVSNS